MTSDRISIIWWYASLLQTCQASTLFQLAYLFWQKLWWLRVWFGLSLLMIREGMVLLIDKTKGQNLSVIMTYRAGRSGALCWYWTLGISCFLSHCLRAFLLQWVLAKLLCVHQQNPSSLSIALSTITSRQCATTTCLLSGETLLAYSCNVKRKL